MPRVMSKELRPIHDLVACDLCERTILKGERIDTFVVGGERRRVCELCTFRAVRARWPREADVEERTPDREPSHPRGCQSLLGIRFPLARPRAGEV